MSAPKKATPTKKVSAKGATDKSTPHHIRFVLIDVHGVPISEPRKYVITYTDDEKAGEQKKEGSTNTEGMTAVIKTAGAVSVMLALAPPDSSDCKLVALAQSRPEKKTKPEVRVQLGFSATTVSAAKPADKCETLVVRDNSQTIVYVIKNVRAFNGHLQSLPYLIVDTDKAEVLSDSLLTNGAVPHFTGSNTQVTTSAIHVGGVKTVGIVLGAATCDTEGWKDKNRNLMMYQVEPKPTGATIVHIEEKLEKGPPDSAITSLVKATNFAGIMPGRVWQHITRRYSIDEVQRIVPGNVNPNIRTEYPNEMQIAYAERKHLITAELAARYRQLRADRALEKANKNVKPKANPEAPAAAVASVVPPKETHSKPVSTPAVEPALKPEPIPELVIPCTWGELLEPIYTGLITGPDAGVDNGGGDILIEPLGLTLTLASDASKNAVTYTDLNKAEVLTATHPYTYLMLLDACRECHVTSVVITSTWRPIYGSCLHRLGAALDVRSIDDADDDVTLFTFNQTKVTMLADRFTRYLNTHRYAKPKSLYYKFDNIVQPGAADNEHKDHLHLTADSTIPLAAQDAAPVKPSPISPTVPASPQPPTAATPMDVVNAPDGAPASPHSDPSP